MMGSHQTNHGTGSDALTGSDVTQTAEQKCLVVESWKQTTMVQLKTKLLVCLLAVLGETLLVHLLFAYNL